MGATVRNVFKVIGGSAIGAGIGALLARGTETIGQQGPEAGARVEHDSVAQRLSASKDNAQQTVEEKKESLRERWERAQSAGEAAKVAREAELRAYFREKVDDPTAFPPGAPTRTDT